MTDEHKAALAQGRAESLAVRNYIEFLRLEKPKPRGRPTRSAEELTAALETEEDVLKRLQLRSTLRKAQEAEVWADAEREERLTAEFIKYVASFSERLGLRWADWREEGVPAAVLKQAGLSAFSKSGFRDDR